MNNKTDKTKRIWELDFFRGAALLAMVYFHLIYDLKEFYLYPVRYENGINFYIGRASALIFILVSGISCTLCRHNVQRGWKVLGIGLLISVATTLYSPDYAVKFGILHFLGICMLLSALFSRLNAMMLVILGTAAIWLGGVAFQTPVTVGFLFPLGFTDQSFFSSDYYPLFPWLGVFLYGVAVGKLLYSNKRSLLNFPLPDTLLNKIGRKTLPIYIVHQPITLWLLSIFLR